MKAETVDLIDTLYSVWQYINCWCPVITASYETSWTELKQRKVIEFHSKDSLPL